MNLDDGPGFRAFLHLAGMVSFLLMICSFLYGVAATLFVVFDPDSGFPDHLWWLAWIVFWASGFSLGACHERIHGRI